MKDTAAITYMYIYVTRLTNIALIFFVNKSYYTIKSIEA